ncbi:MAG: FG-GAP repeat protein [Chloroflexi bacterium]|nr:FG-GAP repeat protein [Chloroflexota bacterium]MBU1748744.1 FG-GAP repeat protein [Chloroflexota bacterium]MBU1878943.1 FG-GAP repeat protein [Chloroflexota bacterium]
MKGRYLLIGILMILALAAAMPGLYAALAAAPTRPQAALPIPRYADLAVGVYREDIGTTTDTGAVSVLHGGPGTGLAAAGNQFFYPGNGLADQDNKFGNALAVGDFNGDGYYDLAVGVPWKDVGGNDAAGSVVIFYGTSTGLDLKTSEGWDQDKPDILGTAEAGDHFGYALAAGDFNGDGRDDLAVGVEGEEVNGKASAGAVNVLYGSAAGLTATGNQLWHQDSPGILDATEVGDLFGEVLVAGDFNGDGRDDLAVGVPYENTGASELEDAGVVQVLYGSASGLTATGNQEWYQDSPNVPDTAEVQDYFGLALAAGDFNGDGRDDLAVGVVGEDIGSAANAGVVHVLYGSASGLTITGTQLWSQDSPGILDAVEAGDGFGGSLAAGDLNGDGRDDLAVGACTEDTGASEIENAGVVHVLYGSASGLTATGNQEWYQDSPGILDAAEAGDAFGSALAAGDLNGDGRDDLAVGVSYEDTGASEIEHAGVVHVLYGTASGLTATGNQEWYQDSPGIQDVSEAGDNFGWALAAIPRRTYSIYVPADQKNYTQPTPSPTWVPQ